MSLFWLAGAAGEQMSVCFLNTQEKNQQKKPSEGIRCCNTLKDKAGRATSWIRSPFTCNSYQQHIGAIRESLQAFRTKVGSRFDL